LTGHLATLLAMLCVDNSSNLAALLNELPGKTPSDKLGRLLQNVESFAASYNEVLAHLSRSKRSTSSPNAELMDKHDSLPDNFALEVARHLRSLCNDVG
jgi:hypothetical protein